MIKPMRTIIFYIILCTQSCEKIAMDRDFPLYFQNNANHSVKGYLNDDEYYMALYPDTVISDFEERLGMIESNEKARIAGGSATWESIYEVSVPNDTISIFIFHPDTLALYDWEIIRTGYKALRRYDLSLQDLNQLNFIVPYPPSPEMAGMKMWPPY